MKKYKNHKSFISESFSNSGSFESIDKNENDSEEPDPLSSDSDKSIGVKKRKSRPNKKRPWIGQLPPAKPLKRFRVLPKFLDFEGGEHSDEFDPEELKKDANDEIKPI